MGAFFATSEIAKSGFLGVFRGSWYHNRYHFLVPSWLFWAYFVPLQRETKNHITMKYKMRLGAALLIAGALVACSKEPEKEGEGTAKVEFKPADPFVEDAITSSSDSLRTYYNKEEEL